MTARSTTFDNYSLVQEQDRIDAQIIETKQLILAHTARSEELSARIARMSERRGLLSQELDFETRTFVSDSGARIADTARRRAMALSSQQRLRDYLKLFDKLDALISNRRKLQADRQELEARIEAASRRRDVAEPRIRHLEKEFESILGRLEVAKFE